MDNVKHQDNMNGFNWERAQQRRTAGLTNATGGRPKDRAIKKGGEQEKGTPHKFSRARSVWRQSALPTHATHSDNKRNTPDWRKKGAQTSQNKADGWIVGNNQGSQRTEDSWASKDDIQGNKNTGDGWTMKDDNQGDKNTDNGWTASSSVQKPVTGNGLVVSDAKPTSLPKFHPIRADNRYRQQKSHPCGGSTNIKLSDLRAMQNGILKSAKITHCEYAGSYNWLDNSVPTILIPGAPPVWTPIRGPHQLKQDKGKYFRDQNSARWRKHPLEPAIRAVLDYNPKFDPEDIDVVTCAGILGSLFKFASSVPWTFGFDMEKVGKTVFIVRREKKPDEIIEGVYGYGHTFPEANTSWDTSVKNSVSHQRIIRYRFAGLNLLVRYEADGYFPNMVHKLDELFEVIGRDAKTSDVDSLVDATKKHQVTETRATEHSTLQIRQAGSIVPQEALFDIKTRHKDNEIDMLVQLPRLWARQMKNFVLAYHQNGFFGEKTIIQDLSTDIEKWEDANQSTLSLVAVGLKRLITEINKSETSRLEGWRSRDGPLVLRAQDDESKSVLPADLTSKWEGTHSETEEEEDGPPSEDEWDFVDPKGKDLLLDY
ncbi:predicted protein [Uncinocarpus reesii 1704]|uniref:Geranylgeranyl pyrophosphate synthetase n=1 Tax=Uncinocarpus reesii (strain UAMH 1704) TaxID=336963 RepID=C4JPR0_UNCRE|nr:uncharacterized protein UREG_04553 [Uncinocarpus reesii 1704]EEP79707.1 predicted protein [Uncinocarpus reesii 1704]